MRTPVANWLKENTTGVIIAVCVIVFCYALFFNALEGFKILGVFFTIFKLIDGHKTPAVDVEEFKRKGLSAEDIENISFVKRWEAKRNEGYQNYIVIDGIIFYAFGIGLLLFLMMVLTFLKDSFADHPGDIFAAIGFSFITGAIAGFFINRRNWKRNQRRFNRLTQPTEKDLIGF